MNRRHILLAIPLLALGLWGRIDLGLFFAGVEVGFEKSDLSNGDVAQYSTTTGKWEPVASSSFGTPFTGDLNGNDLEDSSDNVVEIASGDDLTPNGS